MRGSIFTKLAGALIVVACSFLVTLKVLDFGAPPAPLPRQPTYDTASLPHLGVGETLDFTSGQNRGALLSGWSVPEPLGVWSDGHTAFLGFMMDSAVTPTFGVVRAMVYLFAGRLAEQHIQVWSGDSELAEYDQKDPNAQLEIPLDKISPTNGNPVILRFSLPDASSPSKVEPNHVDPRVMALYLKSLQLRQ